MSIPYRVERTHNKASRAVLASDGILIRLAHGLPPPEERRHIDILMKKMTKAWVREQSRTVIDPFRPLLVGTPSVHVHLVTGSGVEFSLYEGARTRAKKTEDGWYVTKSPMTDDRTMHRFLWRLLSLSAHADATSAVENINAETLRVPVASVQLKYMSSRWGRCSHDGRIALSTSLLFTTLDIFRYVVIHELAHILHHDHSAQFWSAVERHCPDYMRRRKELREYRIVKQGRGERASVKSPCENADIW